MREAQHRLATARAAAEEAKQPLLEAAANIAGINEELRLLRSKRQRLGDVAAPAPAEAAEQTSGEHPPHHDKYKDYSLLTFQREEGKEMWRRSVVPKRLGADAERPPQPRTGASGALLHWRRGLVGAMQSWAVGALDFVVLLTMKLIDHFNISQEIYELLKRKEGVPRKPRSIARAAAATN